MCPKLMVVLTTEDVQIKTGLVRSGYKGMTDIPGYTQSLTCESLTLSYRLISFRTKSVVVDRFVDLIYKS